MPLVELVKEYCKELNIPDEIAGTLKSVVFEDNAACLIVATNQKLTSRTRWFHQKWHWFWQIIRTNPDIRIEKVESEKQWADYLTKPLTREVFERIRKLVQKW